MSTVASAGVIQEFCLQSQGMLSKNPTDPRKLRKKAGMYGAVMNDRNMRAWDYTVSVPGKDKPKQAGPVEAWLEYETPYCSGGTTTLSDTVCNAGSSTSDTRKYLKVEIDKEYSRKFKLSMDEFSSICVGRDERKVDVFRRKAFEILHEINEDLISEYYAVLDNYPVSGLAPTEAGGIATVPIVNGDGYILPVGYSKIISDFRNAHFDGDLIAVGCNKLATYFDVRALSGRALDRGDSLSEAFDYANMNFTYDIMLDSVIRGLEGTVSDSYGLVFPVGSFGALEWYRNTGERELVMEDFALTTIVIDGIKFDLDMSFTKCGTNDRPEWTFLLRKELGIVNIPAAEYCDSKGLKYMYKFTFGEFNTTDLDPS